MYPGSSHKLSAVASVPAASLMDTVAVFADVVLPTLAKGVIMRRPLVLSIADRLDLDHRAIRRMQRVRNKYGSGPLMLRLPGRSLALILDARDVHRVLGETPEPFATATKEKRAALAHFEPRNVLLSQGIDRADRRRFNEQVLDADRPAHRLSASFLQVVDNEVERMYRYLRGTQALTWREFSSAWFRIVRRVVFGESAVEDNDLSLTMAKLRSGANWAFLLPKRTGLRDRLLDRIRTYIARAEPDSLAAVISHTHTTALTAPEQQVPQWLFAFDPAGMAIFRTLALLASHREYAQRVREEIAANTGSARQSLPTTRAAVLESLRLWPTTPLILRESTEQTPWATGELPSNTGVVIFTPFFHRDSDRLPYADRFTPELWTDSQRLRGAAVVPFSEGPAICPGRHLVLLLASAMIASVLDRALIRLNNPGNLSAGRPLPGTLNHFGLRFGMAPISRL